MAKWFDKHKKKWGSIQEPQFVLGLDEVGYGSYAGPLFIGGCLAPFEWTHPSLKDSKAFTGKYKEYDRGEALRELQSVPGAQYFTARSSVERVDELGVYAARTEAFVQLILAVDRTNTLVVLDGDLDLQPYGIEHASLPKADAIVPHVMAASLVAKVSRDTEMLILAKQYPQYNFAKNKGYGSDKKHQAALQMHGPCPLHRKSFKPISDLSGSSFSTTKKD